MRHALLVALTLLPLARAQEPPPPGALLERARAFAADDARFNLMRLALLRAQEKLELAHAAGQAFVEGKTAADLAAPEVRRQAELLALEEQAAREEYERLGTGAGRARYVSLRDRLARAYGELMPLLDQALAAAGDDLPLRLARGELLAGKGRFGEARADAEAAVRLAPEDPRALGLLAMCLVTDNRFEEAEALFRRAVELEPTDERRAYQAIALYCLNRFAEARAVRDQVARPLELPAQLQLRCGWWLTDGELDRAQAAWTREAALRAEEATKDDLPRVELVTARGAITLELFEDHAPNAVAAVVSLVETGFYDGLPFHRVVPNLLAQTGDPAERPGAPEGTRRDAGYRLLDDPAQADPARARSHFRGTVSLSREERPHSGGSQLFIALMPSAGLDALHAPIGRVVVGQPVVDRLREGDVIERARVLRRRDHPYEPRRAP